MVLADFFSRPHDADMASKLCMELTHLLYHYERAANSHESQSQLWQQT
jgi:hypothetical protein